MSIYANICNREFFSEREINPFRFRRDVLSSKYLLDKYELKGLLKGHSGCVNSVLFSQDGQYIFTGSDDTNINIYSTETSELTESFSSIHTNNIFYARDLPDTGMNTILSCAADGRVVITNLETKAARRLYRHRGRAHRIALVPNESNQFYSCGEDGVCCLFDLRSNTTTLWHDNLSSLEENVFTPIMKTSFKNNRDRVCSIYTVGVNPLFPYQVAIGGSSNHIAIYDQRKIDVPVGYLCPDKLAQSSAHVTGLKYDHTGNMLIGSYNDDDVYSFLIHENMVPTRRTISTTHPPIPTRAGTARAATMNTTTTTETTADSTTDTSNLPTSTANPIDETSIDEIHVKQRGYYRNYTGHRNNNTVKQVSFMGGRSDYIVSGSDCGYIFIWDTYTSQLIQIFKADEVGAINCLAFHPSLPILATSGLENDAKVWSPTGESKPLVDGTEKYHIMKRITTRNADRNAQDSYSTSLVSLLMNLLSRGDLPLHGPEEGEGEDSDDDMEEESEGESSGDDMSDSSAAGDESEEEGMDTSEAELAEEEQDGEVSDEPNAQSTEETLRPRRHRWTQAATEASHPHAPRRRRHREARHNQPAVGSIQDTAAQQPGSQQQEDPAPNLVNSSGESEEIDLEGEGMDMDDQFGGDRVGIVINGIPVPFYQLVRFLPALLGRRRRSQSDTGDEEKEQDAMERSITGSGTSTSTATVVGNGNASVTANVTANTETASGISSQSSTSNETEHHLTGDDSHHPTTATDSSK